jgi:hypothetical protein
MTTATPAPDYLRAVLLRLASLAIGCAVSAILLGVLTSGYLGYCRVTGADARLLSAYAPARALFADRAYLDLLRLVTTEPTDAFDTVWDTTDSVMLSRQEFIPTEMYGQAKYRYKPFLRYLDAEVWSGFDRQRLSALDGPEVRAAASRCRVFKTVFIETDAHGFKKTDFPLAPGVPTVLFVGDSFTEGLDVASADTFVNLYGHLMRAAHLPGVPVNAGVNGYGTLEECWTVEQYALPLGARVVVANLFPNDVESDFQNVVRGGRVPEEKYAQMFFYLDRMATFCAAHHIALIVAAIPAREQMDSRLSESPFEARVRAWCRARALPFLDPLQDFRRAGPGEIYFAVDPHLSEKGHARYARFLFHNSLPILEAALEK